MSLPRTLSGVSIHLPRCIQEQSPIALIKLNTGIVTRMTASPDNLRLCMTRTPFSNDPCDIQSPVTRRAIARKPAAHPYRRAKEHIPDPQRTHWYHWAGCACMAYAIADYIWIHGLVDHDLWARQVKAPGLSGYALWIKESTAAFRQGLYAPDTPSISGGFTTSKLEPGYKYQPPADCLPPPCQEYSMATTWLPWSPPESYARVGIWLSHVVTPDPDRVCVASEVKWFYDPVRTDPFITASGPGLSLWLTSPLYHADYRRHLEVTWVYEYGLTLTYAWCDAPIGYHWKPIRAQAVPRGIHLAEGFWM